MWDFTFSANHSYEYCIQRPDGRIVLGGMRCLTPTQEVGIEDDTVIQPTISQGLREFLPRHFPSLRGIKVEQEWTGIMGFSPDYNPLIGPVPYRAGEYIAAGFTGHGMPIAFLAGKAVASMIMGREPDVFVDAFLPSRFVA
jgi:glycine/D-amino acid oxidase-like deaminating enzyme